MKNARPSNAKTSAPKQGDSKAATPFLGTDNPRHLRVLQAVTVRPVPREQLDSVAGINRTGDGAFVILYRGQRHLVVNLRAAEVVVRQFCAGAAP